jgi:hypothetical protein
MTVQDQIDSYIATLLATVATPYGYNTNAGASVYKNLEYTSRPDVIPCIAWFTGELQSGVDVGPYPAEMGETNHVYSLAWEGFIADDLDGAQGRLLKADLIKALFADPHFDGLIETVDGVRSSVAVESGDDIFSCVQVVFTVFYTTPYGQE